jgi:hypothetical protein
MATTLRSLGLTLIGAWAIFLLLAQMRGWEKSHWDRTLFGAGLSLLLGGVVLGVLGRAHRAVRRSRCVRCRQPVQSGQVYCPRHFRESVEAAQDQQEGGPL